MSRDLETNINQILRTNPTALHERCHHKTEICLTSNLSKDLMAPLKGPNCVSQVSGYISIQLVPKYLNPLCLISAEYSGVAGVFSTSCLQLLWHDASQRYRVACVLPRAENVFFFCVGWNNVVYSFQRWLQDAKYSREGMGGRNIRILLMSSFMDSIEFMVLCWCRKLLKI